MVENKSFILLMILVSAKAAPGNVQYQETTTEDFSIIGGTDADIKDVPYQVELVLDGIMHLCGGSLIADNIILTAAHCVEKIPSDKLTVRAGTNQALEGGTLVNIAKINMYPGYDSQKNFSNDVAIIRLAEKLETGPTITPVKMAESGKPPATGSDVIASGWGVTSLGQGSKTLQKVTVPIVDTETCKQVYGSRIDDSMLCAGKPEKGACNGDSGGPLVKDNVQYGIVSWGRAGCKELTVYSNVANLRQWIDQAIKDVQ